MLESTSDTKGPSDWVWLLLAGKVGRRVVTVVTVFSLQIIVVLITD